MPDAQSNLMSTIRFDLSTCGQKATFEPIDKLTFEQDSILIKPAIIEV